MQNQDMKNSNRMFSVFLLISFVALYYITLGFPEKAAIYPRALLNVGIVTVVALFISTFFSKKGEVKKVFINKDELRKLLISVVLMLIYIVLIPVIGYAVSTFLFMSLQIWVLKPKKRVSYIIVALVSTVILYVGFGVILSVWLPKGLFF